MTYRNGNRMMASAVLLTSLTAMSHAQKPPVPEQDWATRPVLRVWPGPAPGSETDTRKESTMHPPDSTTAHIVRNVTVPTLTVFQPKEGNRSKTAVLICPGGGFRLLAIDQEGYEVADWFEQHGMTAFVLKYRVTETPPKDEDFAPPNMPMQEQIKRILAPLPPDAVPHAIADGIQALKVVRENAAKYGYSPDRILALGFSAGGGVVTGTMLATNPAERPNYAAPIYGALLGPTPEIPKDAPPAFLAFAEDDPLVQPMLLRLFNALRDAGNKPELHVYRTGQHGFSMTERGTSDHWLQELWWWMELFGLTHP
jgi:acetyl esterase/lipase